MRSDAHVKKARRSDAELRARAARDLRQIFDESLFRALCEPVRVALIEFLTVHGRSDVATVADAFPQDRSVISRHLGSLCRAGVLRREKVGRHVFFAVDGAGILGRLEEILERFRRVVSICCPPEGSSGRPEIDRVAARRAPDSRARAQGQAGTAGSVASMRRRV